MLTHDADVRSVTISPPQPRAGTGDEPTGPDRRRTPASGSAVWAGEWLCSFTTATACAASASTALRAAADVVAQCFGCDVAIVSAAPSQAVPSRTGLSPAGAAQLARGPELSVLALSTDLVAPDAGDLLSALATARTTVMVGYNDARSLRHVHGRIELFDGNTTGPWLLLLGTEPTSLTADQFAVLSTMAQALSLDLRNRGLLEAAAHDAAVLAERLARAEDVASTLRQRAHGSERLSLIHQSIAARMTLRDVLDAVVAAAAELLGVERVALRLVDPQQHGRSEIVAHVGMTPSTIVELRRAPSDRGLSRRSIAENRLVVVDDYASDPFGHSSVADEGFTAGMAAPVREDGRAVGALVVASQRPGRTFDEAEQELVSALAEQASIALTDARTVKALEDALVRARHQAEHDTLTGLPNRPRLLSDLEHSLRVDATGMTQPVAVVVMDIDGFKVVNETSGHVAGDELLRLMAARVRLAARGGDLAARLGGDEFALLLHGDNASEEHAHAVASRLAQALAVPFTVGGREVLTSVSVGVATARPGDAAGDVLRHADVALHAAKKAGRGRCEIFADHMAEAVLTRTLLESDLRHAVERGELRVAYQPIVSLQTGRIVGTEALVRWRRDGVMVAPLDFIPVAEETGDIIAIGTWVLREATRQAHLWDDLPVNVNVSVKQLLDDDFAAEVVRALDDSGLAPAMLTLEITESVVLQDTVEALARIDKLRTLGVRFALDDFGTGYSSLSYLRRLPVDVLKVDKSFTNGIGQDADDTLLVRAIVELANTLGITTVAEGVETAEQRTQLEQLGCSFGQGFLFARPKTADLLGDHGPHWLDIPPLTLR